MKFLPIIITFSVLTILVACDNQSAESVSPICDTACLKDSIAFKKDHRLNPYVYLTAKDCFPDSIIWSHDALESNRKMEFNTLVNQPVYINSAAIDCFIKDTSYAWLKFNDCKTGRGYLMKLPFSKGGDLSNYTSALNDFDPKFEIAEGLICYADYTFIYVEDMATGKTEKVLMHDQELKINWNNIHETFESVTVTRNKIEANIIVDGNKKKLEKNISL